MKNINKKLMTLLVAGAVAIGSVNADPTVAKEKWNTAYSVCYYDTFHKVFGKVAEKLAADATRDSADEALVREGVKRIRSGVMVSSQEEQNILVDFLANAKKFADAKKAAQDETTVAGQDAIAKYSSFMSGPWGSTPGRAFAGFYNTTFGERGKWELAGEAAAAAIIPLVFWYGIPSKTALYFISNESIAKAAGNRGLMTARQVSRMLGKR